MSDLASIADHGADHGAQPGPSRSLMAALWERFDGGRSTLITCAALGIVASFLLVLAGWEIAWPGAWAGMTFALIGFGLELRRRRAIAQASDRRDWTELVELGGPGNADLPAGMERRRDFLQRLRSSYEECTARSESLTLVIVSLRPTEAVGRLEPDAALQFIVGRVLRRAALGADGARVGALGSLDYGLALVGASAGAGRELARRLRAEVLEEIESEFSRQVRRGLTVRTTVATSAASAEASEDFHSFYQRANRGLHEAEAPARPREPHPPAPFPARERPAWFGTLCELLGGDDALPLQRLAFRRVRANLAFLEYARLDKSFTDLGRTQVFTQMDLFAQGFDVDGPEAAPQAPDPEARSAMLQEVEELLASRGRSVIEEVTLHRIQAAVEFLAAHATEQDLHACTEGQLAPLLDGYVLGAMP